MLRTSWQCLGEYAQADTAYGIVFGARDPDDSYLGVAVIKRYPGHGISAGSAVAGSRCELLRDITIEKLRPELACAIPLVFNRDVGQPVKKTKFARVQLTERVATPGRRR